MAPYRNGAERYAASSMVPNFANRGLSSNGTETGVQLRSSPLTKNSSEISTRKTLIYMGFSRVLATWPKSKVFGQPFADVVNCKALRSCDC